MHALTVYCAASDDVDPVFHASAEALGDELARRGIALVYGGGSRGLMGAVARRVKAGGGHVTGIITERLHGPERAFADADEMLVVPTMRERKRLLIERGDAVAVLPGGIGTMEEFFEALTGRVVGEHELPIGLMDVAGFFDPLIAMLRHSVETRFVRPAAVNLVSVERDASALLDRLIDRAGEPLDHAGLFPPGVR